MSRKWPKRKHEVPSTLPNWVWNIGAAARCSSVGQWLLRFNIVHSRSPMLPKRRRWEITADERLRLYAQDNLEHNPAIAVQAEEFLNPLLYIYHPLPEAGGIRLLTLLPGIGPDIIKCQLDIYQLEYSQKYEALSYTWGDSKVTHQISCDGQVLVVQANLWRALQRLRRTDVPRILWIDAVCINQQDIEERSRQVPCMRYIYSNADLVVVWLGEATNDSPQSFKLLSKLEDLARNEDFNERRLAMTNADLLSRGLPDTSSPKWRALDVLFWRHWYTRSWIIQEISVAKNVLVMCGEEQCPWESFAEAASFIINHSLTAIASVDPRRVQLLHDYIIQTKSAASLKLLPLLSQARHSYSTDDRDKIYAVMGLADDAHDPKILPDYSSDVETVYTSLAEFFIQRDKNLDVLNFVDDHLFRKRTTLPSWVPDWEVHILATPLLLNSRLVQWQAAKMSATDVVFKGNSMISKGQAIDVVDCVGDSFYEYVPVSGSAAGAKQRSQLSQETLDAFAKRRWKYWQYMARRLNHYPTSETTTEAFAKTLIGDADLIDSNADQSLLELYAAWNKYWRTVSLKSGQFVTLTHAELSNTERKMATAYMEAQYRTAYGRKFFTTRNGYMGMCPSGSCRGDIVVLLFGGRTPYVLRRVHGIESSYMFVGECYIHGIMNGEALRDNSESTDFIIM